MSSPLRPLRPYFWNYKHLMIPGILFCIISAGFTVIVPMAVRQTIDALPRMVAHHQFLNDTAVSGALDQFTAQGLLTFGGTIVLLSFLSGLFLFLMRQTIVVASRHIEYDLRNTLYEHVQKLSARFFQEYSTGDVITRATSDIEQVRRFIGPAVMYTARSLVIMVVALSVMIIISPTLTFYALLPMPVLAVAIFFMSRLIHTRSDAIQKQYSVLTSRVQEAFSGIRVLKAYSREQYEVEAVKKDSETYRQRAMSLVRVEAGFRPVFTILIGLSVITVVWIGGNLYMQGLISIGNIAEYMIYVAILTWPVAALGFVINMIQRAKASMVRLNQILTTAPDIADSNQTNHTITSITGNITFDAVGYTYPNTTTPVLENISFDVPAGTTLAIVGRTGSGKTTLIEMVMRLIDATEGMVKIDNTPIKEIPLEVLRQAISYVSQEVFLFSDSLANNIAFGMNEATQQQIEQAATEAVLIENISDLSNGFETLVGERGITLSGGQKQRTSIARALICEPKILILDDALSAVDTNTEAQILEQIRKHYGKRTCIIVSHRISAVQDADLILVLDEGIITQKGTHESLLSEGGLYADMYTKQLLEQEIEAFS